MSPTERTLRWLRKQGFVADVVERRLPHAFITKDLFGCIDIVALKEGWKGAYGLQVTSASHLQERIRKILAEPRAKLWVEAGNHLWIVGWAKQGAVGKRKLWTPHVVVLAATDFIDALAPDSATLPV